jgi:hypothetical protein
MASGASRWQWATQATCQATSPSVHSSEKQPDLASLKLTCQRGNTSHGQAAHGRPSVGRPCRQQFTSSVFTQQKHHGRSCFERMDCGSAGRHRAQLDSACRKGWHCQNFHHIELTYFKPNKRTALSFKIPGITSGLKPATSKSFIHRSGVMRG